MSPDLIITSLQLCINILSFSLEINHVSREGQAELLVWMLVQSFLFECSRCAEYLPIGLIYWGPPNIMYVCPLRELHVYL